MDIKKVLQHYCFQKDHPLSPVRCRCRKYITTVEAARLITQGAAQFVIKGYKNLEVEEICPLCLRDEKNIRTCDACKHTGKVIVTKKLEVYGDDVITTIATKGKRLANATAKKTPRSPTIESEHVERSVGVPSSDAPCYATTKTVSHGAKVAARERIFEYQNLTLKERLRLLAVDSDLATFEEAWRQWTAGKTSEEVWKMLYDKAQSPLFLMKLRYEPVDDAKTGTGRRFDYGRSV